MKYRQCYDKVFLARKAGGERLIISGKRIADVSVLFEYRVYDKATGREVEFECEGGKPYEQQLDGHSLNEYFKCSYDREKGFIMTPTKLHEESRYRVEFYELSHYWAVLPNGADAYSESEEISGREFEEVLKEHPEYFDNSDNRDAQNCAFSYTS